jgi:hypothetical protein
MTESRSRRQASPSRRSGDELDVVEQLRELKGRAAEVAGAVCGSATDAAGQVKEKAAQMTKAISKTVKEEAERLFDEQKGKAASKVTRYGKVIHQAAHALKAVKADGLAEYVDSAAEKVEGVTDYLEERNLAQVLLDAGEVARRHPGMTIGGMFVAGFALARFLKASDSREDAGENSGDEDEGDEDEGEESSRGRQARGGGSRR